MTVPIVIGKASCHDFIKIPDYVSSVPQHYVQSRFNISVGEDDLNEKMRKADSLLKSLHKKEDVLNQKKYSLEEDEERITHEIRITNNEHNRLKLRLNARLEFLQKNEPDVYEAIKWLDKNKHLFHSTVFKPMLLEVSIISLFFLNLVRNQFEYNHETFR